MVIITAILILIIVLTVPGRPRAVATIASIFLKHALKSTHDDYEADTSACVAWLVQSVHRERRVLRLTL